MLKTSKNEMINAIKTLTIIFIIFPTYYFSQVKVQKHITTEDGLISNQILSIMQDSRGYMWFSTYKGISVWDGNNFRNLNKDNGLTSTAILDMIETPDSVILLSTFGSGLITLKNNKLDTIDTKDGLGTNFVLKLRLINDEPILITYPIQTYVNKEIKTYFSNPEKLEGGAITDFFIDEDSTIYITSKKGFYVKDGEKEILFTKADGLRTSVTSFLEKDKTGNILIASSNGLNKYSDGKITTLEYNGKPVDWTISSILCSEDSTNYYSGDNGLLIEKDGRVELLTTENGLLENPIFTLAEDNYGNIYLGYAKSGISIYSPDKFTNYISYEFAANSIVQYDNKLLLGTENGITLFSDFGIKRITNENGLTGNYVRTLFKNNDNDVFIGTDIGLNLLKNNQLKYSFKTNKSTQGIYAFEYSNHGDLLMAVRRQGITILSDKNNSQNPFSITLLSTKDSANHSKSSGHGTNNFGNQKVESVEINEGVLNYVNRSNGLLSSWILDLLFTKDSSLVIGYHGSGVSFYKNGEFKHLTKDNGLTDGIIQNIFENSDGSLWFGTGQGGIIVYKNSEIIDTIDINDGLSSNDIRGIVEFKNSFYVSTDKGLNRIESENGNWNIKKIDNNDGLISNNCNNNAIYLDNQNNLWIGTPKGLTKFKPEKDILINEPPKIYLTGLEIFNQTYPIEELEKSKELDYNQNYLKFIYTGINLSAPEKIIYQYKLDGIDEDWIKSNDNSVQYTSLDDGDYTFEVKAMNEWGYWSEPTALSFVINPAWWETWWFYSILVLLIGSLIAFIASYRYKNLLAVERIRTKISTDLHDSIGSGLSEITIISELLNTQPNANVEDLQKGLKNISITSRSLVGNMSDIVWLVNPKKDSLKDLLLRLQDSYQEVLAQANVSFEIKNIENLIETHLTMTFRQHLFLLFKEAINNALKYSKCSDLILEINQIGNELKISLKDNGIGFDMNKVNIGNGMVNMKERAEAINGKLEIISKINEGTTLKFLGNI